jgi:cytochrome c-type biogenesis protein CcmH/NrfF
LIIYGACYLAASLYAVTVQWKNWRLLWFVPFVYLLVGGVEALLAGSVVGLM